MIEHKFTDHFYNLVLKENLVVPKFAVLSDIHGNSVALQAVLTDLYACYNIDQVFVLGDLVVFGPDPAGVIDILRTFKPLVNLRGNTDRYLLEEKYPLNIAQDWQSQVLASFDWTAKQLSSADFEYLRDLSCYRLIRFDGSEHTVLAVHGSPRSDEENIRPDTPEAELSQMLKLDVIYDLLLCAHTHVPMDRVVDGVRVINTGSVGLPFDGDPRASYVVIDQRSSGDYKVEFRRVAYDVDAVVRQLVTRRHPAAAVQTYNLRRALPVDRKLIYTDAMRQGHNLQPAGL